MSYMRSPYYVWSDGTFMYLSPSEMTLESFDELCAMRWAQLTSTEREGAITRALRKFAGNGGCDALCKLSNVPGFSKQLEIAVEEMKKETNQSQESKHADAGYINDVKFDVRFGPED